MNRDHDFAVSVEWTGNSGEGTATHRSYRRDHVVRADGPGEFAGSSARVFHGDASRWNPEQLFIAALAQCHMLSYFYVAARAGVVVTAYRDEARGTLRQHAGGGGAFAEVVLRPRVTVPAGTDPALAERLHAEAHAECFIAASVAVPVRIEPSIEVAG